jgi:hypothetical protein
MNELQEAAVAVRNQISAYEKSTLGFRVFEPIDEGHAFHQAVERLKALYPSQQLPSPGRGLWRDLVSSANLPAQEHYLKVFDDLEKFEEWLVTTFTLEPPAVPPPSEIQVEQKSRLSEPDLTEKQDNVYQAIDDTPRPGTEITERSGEDYEFVRKTVSVLIRMGLITRVRRGYRRVPLS